MTTPDLYDVLVEKLNRFRQAERKEVQELFRVACSSVTTSRWMLMWLGRYAGSRYVVHTWNTYLGTDPNG
jgi:hypothetical protein